MSFTFGFSVGDDQSVAPVAIASESASAILPIVDVPYNCDVEGLRQQSTLVVDGLELQKAQVDVDAVTGLHRDVVRGAYEGGGKTWECTYDLLHYLRHNPAIVAGRTVLDLGCGTGMLGCLAIQLRAKHVILQDLNEPVLRHITNANVALNSSSLARADMPQVQLVAGDWHALLQGLRDGSASVRPGSVELLLSSETLYDPAHYGVLLDLLAALLVRSGSSSGASQGQGATGSSSAGMAQMAGQPAGGIALFATKRFYFGAGLGGGSDAFIAAAAAHAAGFVASRAAVVQDGKSMIRDILRVEWAAGAGQA